MRVAFVIATTQPGISGEIAEDSMLLRKRVLLVGPSPDFWETASINRRDVDLFPVLGVNEASAMLAAFTQANFFSLVIVDGVSQPGFVAGLTSVTLLTWLDVVPNVLVFTANERDSHLAVLRAVNPECVRVYGLSKAKAHDRDVITAVAKLTGVRNTRVVVPGLHGMVVQFRIIRSQDGSLKDTKSFGMGFVVNIGVGGALVTSTTKLDVGTRIGFVVGDSFCGTLLPISGYIIRRDEKQDRGDTIFQYGVQFVGSVEAPAMSPEVAAALEAVCKRG